MISVVMATYNGAPFIEGQLRSILPQLGPGDEIVVSDDGSTDGTLAVVSSVKDARVRVLVNEARVGYVGNFERAARVARGSIIFFADQDDIWLDGKVEALLEALQTAAFAASDARVVDVALQTIHPSYREYRGTRSMGLLDVLLKPPIVGATMACRRSFLNSLLPFPRGVPHDFWLSFNAAWAGQLAFVDRPLILYRRHSSAASLSAAGRSRSALAIARERTRLLVQFASRRLGMVAHGK